MSEPELDTTPLMSNIQSRRDDQPIVGGDEGVTLKKSAIAYANCIYNHWWFSIVAVILVTIFFTLVLVLDYGVMPYADTNYYRWNGDEITQRWDSYVGASKHNYGSLLGLVSEFLKLPKQFQLFCKGRHP